ncbi:MAG: dUTP diphosphatase [Oscillospiraceae bacterium]|nr:dUTP diphosphatase [Oscillospiraceae bacterium]
MKRLPIKLLTHGAKMPTRKTSGSVGYDIAASMGEDVVIEPGETRMIGAGFAIALEPGYAAFIYARSGLGIKNGIIPANCVGVVDSDYRGEIIVGLKNTSAESFTVRDGDRIAQMVIAGCELPQLMLCEDLDETRRGSDGFGSTGTAQD